MADNNEIFDLLSKMYSELTNKIDNMNSEMHEMKHDIKQLKNDVTKNTITLENMDSNIKLLAEGQESFREQIGRHNEHDSRTINDKLETIEIAVTHTSKSVNNLNETIDVIKDTTASNNLDIKILKRLQKSSI